MFFLLCRNADDGIFDNFPKISDHFPKIAEEFRGRPEDFFSYTHEFNLRDKLDISEIIDIFTSEDMENTLPRWSGDVMKGPGHKNFNAVSQNRSRPEVLFFNLTWRSQGQILSVLLQLLLSAFSNRKFGRHGKWSLTFWQWENNT